ARRSGPSCGPSSSASSPASRRANPYRARAAARSAAAANVRANRAAALLRLHRASPPVRARRCRRHADRWSSWWPSDQHQFGLLTGIVILEDELVALFDARVDRLIEAQRLAQNRR